MQKFEFGDVVLAEFWRDDGKGKKERPCLVLQCVGGQAIEVVFLTSQNAHIGGIMPHEVIVACDDEKREMGLSMDSRISMKSRDIRVIRTTSIIKTMGRATRSVLTRCAVAWKNGQ